ncbi:MAG: hypothetical protein Q4E39_05235 [bacterium]|nr:hypothetical protein [bacterium]
MKTNSSMTLYHKDYNKKTRLDEWIRYPIENVMWQGGEGASINKGYDKANDITVFIPYNKNKELENVPFSIGDIILKGNIDDNITKQSDLKVNNYNITTIIDNNYGSSEMKHIQLGAK